MRMDVPPSDGHRVSLFDVLDFLDDTLVSIAFFAVCVLACLALSLLPARAGAVPPKVRLARALPTQAVERHALRERHNAALKTLFAETGIPLGSSSTNIELRTRAIELINMAITNRVELDGAGVTADTVAFAAYDFVGRYVLGQTNMSTPMPERITQTCETLIVGDSHAACRLPHSGVDAWTVAELLGVPASNRLAVSGSTARQWAADHNGWLSSALSNRAQVVWISLGGNDVTEAAADGSVSTPEQLAIASDLFCVVATIARGRKLVIGTLYADPYQGSRPADAQGLALLDAGISNVVALACGSVGVRWALLDERGVLGASDYDGSGDLHPASSGYTKMADEIIAIINKQGN